MQKFFKKMASLIVVFVVMLSLFVCMPAAAAGEKTFDISLHIAGATSPEDFFRYNSVVYSSVRRAKGNESYMVYIVNAQNCVNSLQRHSDRNALFTAITRSKGWVKVLGYGEDMIVLNEEFQKIRENNYKLHFTKYPTEEEQKTIFLNNQDVQDKDRKAFDQTRVLIDRLTSDGSMTKAQLLKKLFDADAEELIRVLQESDYEQ